MRLSTLFTNAAPLVLLAALAACSGAGRRPTGPADLLIARAGAGTLDAAGEGRVRLDGEVLWIERGVVEQPGGGTARAAFVCRLAGGRGRIEIFLDGRRFTDEVAAVVDVGDGPEVFLSDSVRIDTLADGGAWVRGTLGLADRSLELDLVVYPDDGSLRFEVEGTRARVDGTLGRRLSAQLDALAESFPDVDTLVLHDVPGGFLGSRSLEALDRLRARGLTTVIPRGGEVASAGVCLFVAGTARRIEPGGLLGVHDWRSTRWRDGGLVRADGREVDASHPLHELLRAHFASQLVEGEAFYRFSSEAAGHDDIHWLDREEIRRFGLETTGER